MGVLSTIAMTHLLEPCWLLHISVRPGEDAATGIGRHACTSGLPHSRAFVLSHPRVAAAAITE